MLGITFELLNFASGLVDVSQETARGFAVEAGSGDERVVTLFPPWPGLRVEFGPIVPAFFRREGREMDAGRARIEGFVPRLCLVARCVHLFVVRISHQSDFNLCYLRIDLFEHLTQSHRPAWQRRLSVSNLVAAKDDWLGRVACPKGSHNFLAKNVYIPNH